MIRINLNSIYDTEKLENELNKMSEQGYRLKNITPAWMSFEKKDEQYGHLEYSVRYCFAPSLHEISGLLPQGWSVYKIIRDRVLILTSTGNHNSYIPDVMPFRYKRKLSSILKTIVHYLAILLVSIGSIYCAIASTTLLGTTLFICLSSALAVLSLIDVFLGLNRGKKVSKLIRGVYKLFLLIFYCSFILLLILNLLLALDVNVVF